MSRLYGVFVARCPFCGFRRWGRLRRSVDQSMDSHIAVRHAE